MAALTFSARAARLRAEELANHSCSRKAVVHIDKTVCSNVGKQHVRDYVLKAPLLVEEHRVGKVACEAQVHEPWLELEDKLLSSGGSQRTSHHPLRFTKLSPHLEQVDITYLLMHGAFTVPSKPLSTELVHSYISYIHPHLPFLKIDGILDVLGYRNLHGGNQNENQNENRKSKFQISLLLYQAVMFAGSTVIDLKHLKQAGYESRTEAEAELFQRVRLLYDLDTCSDRHSIAQALLLMTHMKSAYSDGKDRRHWLGLAVSLAFSLGWNRSLSYSFQTTWAKEQHKLERRIWWCAFVLDRILPLSRETALEEGPYIDCERGDWEGAGRLLISLEDCGVPILCLEDFDLIDLVEEAEFRGSSRDQAQKFIEKVRLSWCSSKVLLSQLGPPQIVPDASSPLRSFSPKSHEAQKKMANDDSSSQRRGLKTSQNPAHLSRWSASDFIEDTSQAASLGSQTPKFLAWSIGGPDFGHDKYFEVHFEEELIATTEVETTSVVLKERGELGTSDLWSIQMQSMDEELIDLWK